IDTLCSVVTLNPGSWGSSQSTVKPTPARSVLQSLWWVVQTQPAPTPDNGSVTAKMVTVVVPSPLSWLEMAGNRKYVGFCDGIFGSGASARATPTAMTVIAWASKAEIGYLSGFIVSSSLLP